MKRTYLMIALTVIALVMWAVQKTPMAFLSPNVTDFVGGLAFGLGIGSVMAIAAVRT